MQGLIAGNDPERQILRPLVAVAAVSHTGDLGKYLFANIRDQRWNSSHVTASNIIKIETRQPKTSRRERFYATQTNRSVPLLFSFL